MLDQETEKALTRRVINLAWFTIAYNLLEGAVCVYFGYKNRSTLLIAFGIDSFLEVLSAKLVLLRFNREFSSGRTIELRQEQKASLAVGWIYLFMSALTALGALASYAYDIKPAQELHGLIISAVSLSFMFFLWQAKDDTAVALNNSLAKNDAYCAMACIKFSFMLFLGNLLYFVMPDLWYIDAGTTILFAAILCIEGMETIKLAQSHEPVV